MPVWFPVGCTLLRWNYRSRLLVGRCKIDNKRLKLRLTLTARNIDTVPDVLLIERWASYKLHCRPTTVEEFAVRAAKCWGMTATVRGVTRTHGVIQVTVAADNIGISGTGAGGEQVATSPGSFRSDS